MGGGFIVAREKVQRTYKMIQDLHDFDFEKMVNDPYMHHWMLIPTNLDATGLVTGAISPQNIDIFREVLFEEVLTDKSDAELLQKPFQNIFYWSLDSSTFPNHAKIEEDLNKAGSEQLKDRYFYNYHLKVQV